VLMGLYHARKSSPTIIVVAAATAIVIVVVVVVVVRLCSSNCMAGNHLARCVPVFAAISTIEHRQPMHCSDDDDSDDDSGTTDTALAGYY